MPTLGSFTGPDVGSSPSLRAKKQQAVRSIVSGPKDGLGYKRPGFPGIGPRPKPGIPSYPNPGGKYPIPIGKFPIRPGLPGQPRPILPPGGVRPIPSPDQPTPIPKPTPIKPGLPPYLPPGGQFPKPQPGLPIGPKPPFDPAPWEPIRKPGLPPGGQLPRPPFPGNPTPPQTTVPPNSVLAPIFAIPSQKRTPMEAQLAKEYEDYVAKRDSLAKGSPERAAHDYSYMSAAARARQAANLEIAKKERASSIGKFPSFPPVNDGGMKYY